jgi:hypothetical protein
MVALNYLVSVVVGLAMVHVENDLALGYRDRIVAQAQSSRAWRSRSRESASSLRSGAV